MFKGFTRYYRDASFRADVDAQFVRADHAASPGTWITYAIHDPTRDDHIEKRPDGLIIYVGQSKEFGKRVRKRMRNAGIALNRPRDRIDGACYDIMRSGKAPRFSVIEETQTALDSLVSETNWSKLLRRKGYPLLNQWTEQKFVGDDLDRMDVPHAWIWPFTVSDALGSRIDLIALEPTDGKSVLVDLSTFPAKTRLREIREHLRQSGRQARLRIRDPR